MDEIKLLYSADKANVARQLQAALGEAGYRIGLEEISAPEGGAIAGRARGAEIALLVWSRELAASAVLDDWLRELRAVPGLIELSSDGIAPQEGDESRIVLLSGWRGQPFHQGWQRLLGELRAAHGAPAPPPSPVVEPDRPPAAAAPEIKAPARRPGRSRLSGLALAALGAIVVVAGIGAVLLGRGGGPADRPQQAAPPAEARAPAAAAPAGSEVAGAESPPPPMSAVTADTANDASAPTPAQTPAQAASPPTRRAPASAGHRAQSRGPVPTKLYSRRNSRTMRLFCARAGRHTPQCRIFLHSVGAR